MTESLQIHGHDLVFNKNQGKAIIEIDLGDRKDECILVDIFSVDEKDYIALLSTENSQFYLFYYSEVYGEENISLETIEDEEEIEEIFHLFGHYWTDEKIDELIDAYNKDQGLENDDL